MNILENVEVTNQQKTTAIKVFLSAAIVQAGLIALGYTLLWWMKGIKIVDSVISNPVLQAFFLMGVAGVLMAIFLRSFGRLNNPIIEHLSVSFTIAVSIATFLAVAFMHGIVIGIYGSVQVW
ncbi:MAG: hypothetical protein U9N57_01185 [Pseudomonadota bacterium]|nr:hypothetical protein [Pseudomonadota bacterium]